MAGLQIKKILLMGFLGVIGVRHVCESGVTCVVVDYEVLREPCYHHRLAFVLYHRTPPSTRFYMRFPVECVYIRLYELVSGRGPKGIVHDGCEGR